jgi:flavodoxin
MRILVTCFSQTGNTRRVAEAVRDESGSDAELKEFP